jgi:predicted DCC family thiol-disulfide oxidoreductase YuxK
MQNPILLFDGVCNLCSGAVQFILNNDREGKIKMASLQSNFGQNFLLENQLPTKEYQSLIFIENNQYFTQSEAFFKLIQYLPNYKWLTIFNFLPVTFSNFFYRLIAKNRYAWFGKKNECWLPSPTWKDRFLD